MIAIIGKLNLNYVQKLVIYTLTENEEITEQW